MNHTQKRIDSDTITYAKKKTEVERLQVHKKKTINKQERCEELS